MKWSRKCELIDDMVHQVKTLLSILDFLNFIKLFHMASSWCNMIFCDNGVSSAATMICDLGWHVCHDRDHFLSWTGFKYHFIIDMVSTACHVVYALKQFLWSLCLVCLSNCHLRKSPLDLSSMYLWHNNKSIKDIIAIGTQ